MRHYHNKFNYEELFTNVYLRRPADWHGRSGLSTRGRSCGSGALCFRIAECGDVRGTAIYGQVGISAI